MNRNGEFWEEFLNSDPHRAFWVASDSSNRSLRLNGSFKSFNAASCDVVAIAQNISKLRLLAFNAPPSN